MPSTTTKRRTRSLHVALLLLLLLSLVCTAASVSASTQAHNTPYVRTKRIQAKREYGSHAYYVVQLDPSSLASPHDVALQLGAEHVEQVGELRHHYLIRARHHIVERGEPQWTPIPSTARQDDGARARTWPPKTSSFSHTLAKRAPTERDLVLERFDLIKRGAYPTQRKHLTRSLRNHILSLERQTLRLRVKRDHPVLPPSSSFLTRTKRSLVRLVPRQDDDDDSDGPDGTKNLGQSLMAKIASKFGIVDPLWPKQWHLFNGKIQDHSINVTGVWEQGITGKGVNVAIVDDGLDFESDDLAANFFAEGSWDYNAHTALPKPLLDDDQHGTRCAGEVSAVKNDVCGVGVAYRSGIAGIRILSSVISDADEAASLNYGFQSNDIYSCSWGPPDDGRSMEAPSNLITKAMLNGVQNGRNGKGSIFVFASGNGGGFDDQCNFDGYTNSLMSITVGAIDRKGLHPFYSEACAAVMVVTYSSGSGDNIHTTDVGKNKCTDRHGGTSAAAPIAAGIFALALEVRPELTWRDMQHLCVQTAVQINPKDPDWQMTATGHYYNHKYGFGKLDAFALVERAKTIPLAKPQAWWASPETSAGAGNVTPRGITSMIEVTQEELNQHNFEKVEHVTVTVHVEHTKRGNVEIELTSPQGMKSILARPRRSDDAQTGYPGWVFMSVKHWDENPVGTWTLRVRDRQEDSHKHKGKFHSWSIRLWGSSIDPSIAEPYRLPGEHHYDVDPTELGDEAEQNENSPATAATPTAEADAEPTPIPTTSSDEAESEPTKVLAKPTDHLPENHAEAPGEAHLPFGDYDGPEETSPPSNPDGTDASWTSGNTIYDATPGYLAGMRNLVGSTTWLFVAVGTIIVFVAGVTAFFWMRRAGRGGTGGLISRARGYDFAPMNEEDEDVPMSAMERGRVRVGSGGGSARTKDLFNAFALDSDEEDEEDREGGKEDEDEERKRIIRGHLAGERYHDEEDDDESQDREIDEKDVETRSRTLVEKEAREHFSD
ncbi:BQ2448_5570 [Microbotryum intermedium]|uniref:BQ2448_5570 protein n=1 Tax=Microbotryum intermedium TaxID=269621 RepID=A0A238F565_9BASI|nr:BQ2448_5570 [Microbotryum intermedium]